MMEISVIDRCITPDTVVICAGRILVQQNPDRKSTRLNSSHSQISYAVFCLKKKKRYVFITPVSLADTRCALILYSQSLLRSYVPSLWYHIPTAFAKA